MAQTDDIERLTRIIVRQHQGGLAGKMRYGGLMSVGGIAKACGVTPGEVESWERGDSQPTTQQGLAWLSYLYERTRDHGEPPEPLVNGQRDWGGFEPQKDADIHEVVLKPGGQRRVFEPTGAPRGDLEYLTGYLSKRQLPGSAMAQYRLFYPPNALFACMHEDVEAGRDIKVEHALDKTGVVVVHNIIWDVVGALAQNDRQLPVTQWLAEQWDRHVKWKGPSRKPDLRVTPPGRRAWGPADDLVQVP